MSHIFCSFTLITAEEILAREKSLGFQDVFANAALIQRIRQYHWVGDNEIGELMTKRYSTEEIARNDVMDGSSDLESKRS